MLKNLLLEKISEKKLLPNLDLKLIIKEFINLLFKEKELMLILTELMIVKSFWILLLNLFKFKMLPELKMFVFQEKKSSHNLLSKNTINKMIFIMSKILNFKEYQLPELFLYLHHLLINFLFWDKSHYLFQTLMLKVILELLMKLMFKLLVIIKILNLLLKKKKVVQIVLKINKKD